MHRYAFALFLLLGSCQACKKAPEPVVAPVAMPEPTVVAPKPATPAPEPEKTYAFQRVQFQFDSTEPTSATMSAIRSNVEIMQQFPDLRIEIQGHADERGTTEYNIALGERRAYAVRASMVRMGIAETRISVVSYGEERPRDRASNESAWGQNRRAEFRVLSSKNPVQGTVN